MMQRGSILILTLTAFLAPVAQAQSLYQPPSLEATRAAFGGAVAAGDHEVFVGETQSFKDPGLVHVFRRSATGAWTEAGRLSAPDGYVGDGFGQVLAVSGNTLLVGMPQVDDGQGAVYVFERNAAGAWAQSARLSAGEAGSHFGSVLAFDGDDALIGAADHDEHTGAVYVFRREAAGGGWLEYGMLAGSAAEEGARFGSAIAVDGDRALVGASSQGAGTVYAFRHDAQAGTWHEAGQLGGSDFDVEAGFGSVLHLQGDHAFIGSPRVNELKGAVHVLRFDAGPAKWTQAARLEPGSEGARHLFGASIQTAADEVWIGAPGTGGFAGMVYRFKPDAGQWVEAAQWVADDVEGGDFFAGALAVHGDVAVVGTTGADYGEGVAFILEHDPATGAWQTRETVFNKTDSMAPITGSQMDCTDGTAASFSCRAVDLVSFLPLQVMGLARGVRLSDVWGWTDAETGKEYALVGHLEATAFVDVSDPFNPAYLGELPRTDGSPGSTWRDIKVYKDHAFIVADGADAHGIQIFDLRQLRSVANPPATFKETAHYDGIHSAHNIVINEETGFAYSVGSSSGGETCGGGLHMIDIREPANPAFAGCFADPATGRASTGYSHDAQCVIYHGPDAEHQGKEICFGANETAISIADVTDKDNPVPISTGAYPNFGYVHQGWLSEDQRYFFQNDELDELSAKVERTRTLVWDVSDLDDPVLAKEYFGEASSTDHNLYIKGNLMYQTNNASGLRVIDVSDPENPVEVGFFDTTPYGFDVAGFNGTWSSYPYFESGLIVVTSRREGLFVLKKREVDI